MENDELITHLAGAAVWVEPPPDLQERIVATIAHARRPDARPGSGRRSHRVRYAILAAAAAVLLAVGIAIGVTHERGRPVEYAATLRATALAPGASGRATLTQTSSGWRIQLHASGLPRRDDGTYYEAWLESPAGVLVPVGTFNQFDDVTLWSGVAPSSFPLLTVTRQRAGADQSSSGQVVLAGTSRRIH